MSDGATHFKASVVTTALVAPLAFYALDTDLAVAFTIGTVVGWVVTPDVRDIERKTYPSFFLSTIPLIGWFVEIAFLVFWFPLALILPHRSKLSHLPFLGTFIALIYAIAYSWLWSRGLWLSTYHLSDVFKELLASAYFSAFFLGWCVPDIVHWLMDGAPIGRRRGFKRRRNAPQGSFATDHPVAFLRERASLAAVSFRSHRARLLGY